MKRLPPWLFARFVMGKNGVLRKVSEKVIKGKRIVENPEYTTAPIDGFIMFMKDPMRIARKGK